MFNPNDILKLSLGKFLTTLVSTPGYSNGNNLFEFMGFGNTRSRHRSVQPPADFLSWLPKLSFEGFGFGARDNDDAEETEDLIDQNDWSAELKHQQDLNRVFDAMMLLPKDQRNILIMVNIHGMRYEEVASKLNVSIGLARARLSAARDELQYLLEKSKSPASAACEILNIKGARLVQRKELINATAANETV